jgi:hypothetical protein
MTEKSTSRIELTVKCFDQWHFHWSCNQTTWDQLKTLLNKGLAIGTAIAIGFSSVNYGVIQVSNHWKVSPKLPPIEQPVQKGE